MKTTYFVFALFLLAGALGAPKGENSDSKDEEDLVLPFAVISYKFKLPPTPFYEVRFTNDGMYFVRFPYYTVFVHERCPFTLVENEHLVTRVADKDHCLTTADLTYWSKEDSKEIILDTFKIDKKATEAMKGKGDKKINPLDAITVYKAPEGNVHHVTLALTDKTCRMMRYTVTGNTVKASGNLVDCKIVQDLNEENDKWVTEHKEAAKVAEATKIVAEAKEKQGKEIH